MRNSDFRFSFVALKRRVPKLPILARGITDPHFISWRLIVIFELQNFEKKKEN